MIEKVTESDIETLIEISKRAILKSVEASPEIIEEIIRDTEAHIEQGVSSADHIFLKSVDENGRALGFILLKNGWNLSDLFIDPNFQNQGIGKELFGEMLRQISSREHRGYIRVNSSLNAEGFYLRLGFQPFTPEKPTPDFVVPLIFRF